MTAQELFDLMEEARQANYPNTPYKSLNEIAKTVIDNAPPNCGDYTELLCNVLRAMLYTNSNTVEEMIRRAEESYPERYATMTPEQQKVCDNYRIPYDEMKADLDARMEALMDGQLE